MAAAQVNSRAEELTFVWHELVLRLSEVIADCVVASMDGVATLLGPSISVALGEMLATPPIVVLTGANVVCPNVDWSQVKPVISACRPGFESAVSISVSSLSSIRGGLVVDEPTFRCVCNEVSIRIMEIVGGGKHNFGNRLTEGLLSVVGNVVRSIAGRIGEELQLGQQDMERLKGKVENELTTVVSGVVEKNLDSECSRMLGDKVTRYESSSCGAGSLCLGVEVPAPALAYATASVPRRSVAGVFNWLMLGNRTDLVRVVDSVLNRTSEVAAEAIGVAIDRFFAGIATGLADINVPPVITVMRELFQAVNITEGFRVVLNIPEVIDDDDEESDADSGHAGDGE